MFHDVCQWFVKCRSFRAELLPEEALGAQQCDGFASFQLLQTARNCCSSSTAAQNTCQRSTGNRHWHLSRPTLTAAECLIRRLALCGPLAATVEVPLGTDDGLALQMPSASSRMCYATCTCKYTHGFDAAGLRLYAYVPSSCAHLSFQLHGHVICPCVRISVQLLGRASASLAWLESPL